MMSAAANYKAIQIFEPIISVIRSTNFIFTAIMKCLLVSTQTTNSSLIQTMVTWKRKIYDASCLSKMMILLMFVLCCYVFQVSVAVLVSSREDFLLFCCFEILMNSILLQVYSTFASGLQGAR